jgi:hypothetical protein
MNRIRVRTPSSVRRPVTTYVHMTVLAVRYAQQERRSSPDPGTGNRFGRDVRQSTGERSTTSESRTMHMQRIMDRLERDDYAVDPQKVADAILRRLLAGAGATGMDKL